MVTVRDNKDYIRVLFISTIPLFQGEGGPPNLYMLLTLGLDVYKKYLLWAMWIPRVTKENCASWATHHDSSDLTAL